MKHLLKCVVGLKTRGLIYPESYDIANTEKSKISLYKCTSWAQTNFSEDSGWTESIERFEAQQVDGYVSVVLVDVDKHGLDIELHALHWRGDALLCKRRAERRFHLLHLVSVQRLPERWVFELCFASLCYDAICASVYLLGGDLSMLGTST